MEKERLKLINKIESFKNFKDNWNGYGALPLPENVINKAIRLVNELYPIPEVFPTACDSIQIEWEINGVYVELEIFENEIKLYSERGEICDYNRRK